MFSLKKRILLSKKIVKNNKKIKVDKLGTIIADNVKANNAVINAGCKIWPNKRINGEIKHDIR